MVRILPIDMTASLLPVGFPSGSDSIIASDETYSAAMVSSASDHVFMDTNKHPTATRTRCVGLLISRSAGENVIAEMETVDTGAKLNMIHSKAASDILPMFYIVPQSQINYPLLDLRLKNWTERPSIINIAYGLCYEFPCIENSSLAPAEFNPTITYNNNISQRGAFIGRTVVRKSSSLDIRPLSFVADATRRDEVLQMLAEIETRAFYVHYKVNSVDYVNYGWLDETPTIEYVGDEEYMRISIRMRCPA